MIKNPARLDSWAASWSGTQCSPVSYTPVTLLLPSSPGTDGRGRLVQLQRRVCAGDDKQEHPQWRAGQPAGEPPQLFQPW